MFGMSKSEPIIDPELGELRRVCRWRRGSAKMLRAAWQVLPIRLSPWSIEIEKVAEPAR